jgi:hypothetical protein
MGKALVDVYLEKLALANSLSEKAKIMFTFYSVLFGTSLPMSDIAQFNKLVRAYGDNRVFRMILKTYSISSFDPTNPYGYLYFLCQKDLEDVSVPEYINTETLPKRSDKKLVFSKDLFDVEVKN